jgi:hypothetical protein
MLPLRVLELLVLQHVKIFTNPHPFHYIIAEPKETIGDGFTNIYNLHVKKNDYSRMTNNRRRVEAVQSSAEEHVKNNDASYTPGFSWIDDSVDKSSLSRHHRVGKPPSIFLLEEKQKIHSEKQVTLK